MMTILDQAIATAMLAHQGQYRKGDGHPFIVHPVDVLNRVRGYGVEDIHILCAAVLHDTIEDSWMTTGYLRPIFGDRITELVWNLTDVEDKPKDSWEKYEYLLTFLKKDPAAQVIKLADRSCNVKDWIMTKRSHYAGKYALMAAPIIQGFLTNVGKLPDHVVALAQKDITYLHDIARKRFPDIDITNADCLEEVKKVVLKTRTEVIHG